MAAEKPPKTQLQEIYQAVHRPLPIYTTRQLPNGSFRSMVKLSDYDTIICGTAGANIKEAERIAAIAALRYLQRARDYGDGYDSNDNDDGDSSDYQENLSTQMRKIKVDAGVGHSKTRTVVMTEEKLKPVAKTRARGRVKPQRMANVIALVDLENVSKDRDLLIPIGDRLIMRIYLAKNHPLIEKVSDVGGELIVANSNHRDSVDTQIIIDATRYTDSGQYEKIYIVSNDHFVHPLGEILGTIQVASLKALHELVC